MIKKSGTQWCLYTKDGSRKLGCHATKAGAEAQERAIMARKATEFRGLRLTGATGMLRTANYDGREHLVVPVVAMVEGVVWASNAPVPEFVPAEELADSYHQWNGRGCFAGHPTEGDRRIPANQPAVLTKSFGTIFNTASRDRILETRRLELEAWIDPSKADAVGPDAVAIVQRLQAGERVEVSVGTFVAAEQKDGWWGEQEYHAVWRGLVADHLAFLAKGDRIGGGYSVS
jgi:hypothetical protein